MINNRNIDVIIDADGNRIVLKKEIRFKGKRKIDREDVKRYLQRYVGDCYEIEDSAEIVYIGNELPDEFTGSESRNSFSVVFEKPPLI